MKKGLIINSVLISAMLLSFFASEAQEQTGYFEQAKEYGKRGLAEAQYYGKKYGTKRWKTAKRHKGKIITATVVTGVVLATILAAGGAIARKSAQLRKAMTDAGITEETIGGAKNLKLAFFIVDTLVREDRVMGIRNYDLSLSNILGDLKLSTETYSAFMNNKEKLFKAVELVQQK